MSDTTLAFVATCFIFVALGLWVPFLHRAEAFALRYQRSMEEEIPDLREDDYSPQLWGKAA